ncbi:hypothetical protein [Phenylobacterium sp.]|jgi:hypothetical protein|uniref:hypothetical protein n=1 Tax=Phenylobacterium sp. TaxID=1871053 RepID=UPI002F3FC98C
MSNPNDPYVERTVIEEPAVVRREIASEPARSTAGWWIAAVVATVAVLGAIYLFSNNRSDADLQAARDTGRAEAMVDSATVNAQQVALSASQASRDAADTMARSSAAAAENARQAAARTAENTRDAAANAASAATDAGTPASDTAPERNP